MTGFAGGERHLHRLGIAHLADDDDVGRLTKRGAKRGRKVRRVDADLHVLDDAAAVLMLVFDRILDGDDVARLAQVDLVDQRRQRRRLAGAGRAAEQDQPARDPRQRLDARREAERGQPRNHRRQPADRRRGAAALAVQVDAEPAEVRRAERGIGDSGLAVRLPRVRRQRRDDARRRFLRRRAVLPAAARRAPDTRISGGAPATSSRSLADCSTTRSSHPRSLTVSPVRGRPRRAGVELDDERVEVVGVSHRCDRA